MAGHPRHRQHVSRVDAQAGRLARSAIAAGVLSAAGAIPHDSLEETIVLGEVNLDGTVLPIHGLLPIMLHAKEWEYGD